MNDSTSESLSYWEKVELIRLLDLRQTRDSRRKFFTLFPDDGPLRRELYPKHLAFFEASEGHSEVLFMAANRCLTPWSFVEMAGSKVRFVEALAAGDASVRSWVDGSECDARLVGGFLRGIEPAFRLVLDNGEFFDCSRRHQVLTHEGWTSLGRIVSRASGLHCSHRRSGYQASCVADGYLDGRQPHLEEGNDRARLPSQFDAPEPSRLMLSRADAMERTRPHTHALRGRDRLSSQDDLRRLSGLFEMFSAAAVRQSALPLTSSTQDALRFLDTVAARLQQGCEALGGQESAAFRGLLATESLEAVGNSQLRALANQSEPRCLSVARPGSSIQELHRETGRISILFPLWHPPLVGGRRILAVVPLGYQPIIDGQVPGANNYKAGGVYHHNCGKTTAGAYAMTCHLTGRYPDWWKGRRFHEPIHAWAAGTTNETTRDIVQKELFGDIGKLGTGMIPFEDLVDEPRYRPNTNKSIDYATIRHVSGGVSTIGLKSYEQRRKAFEGTARHVIWLDEEPPQDIYSECLLRTATVDGIIFVTFTPLEGATEVVRSFIEGAEHRV